MTNKDVQNTDKRQILYRFKYRVRMALWLACAYLIHYVVGLHPSLVISKTIIRMVQTASLFGTQVLGYEFGSANLQCKRFGNVWNYLWGHAF